MAPWTPDDVRWRWATLGALILITLALMFGGQVFGQGDGRPPFQAIPILGVTTADEMVKMGDLTNHAMRVSIVSGGTSNVNVISSVLPTGAALDVSVQNIEAAIREAMQPFGGGFATSGMAMGAKDPSGFMASLSVDNSGNLKVTASGGGCDNFATVTMGWQAGNQQVITGTVGQNIRICSIMLIVASSTAISIIEGSGVLCNTNKAPIFGSTSTSNGLNITSTGGLAFGNGLAMIGRTQTSGDNVCIANSTSAVIAGGLTWTTF